MIARIARRRSSIVAGAVIRLLVLALLSGALSACLASAPPSAPKPDARKPTATPARATRTPKPAATPTPRPASAAAKANWTVLVYLDGDNDLEQDAIGDFAEMASVGSNDALNIVVQFDRVKSSDDWDASSYGDWGGVKRFRVERGKKPVASNQLADLGELNMGSPRTLVDFASWGIQAYPAQHYALIFWDHGAAWPGVASDDSSSGDMLTLPELAGALADVQQRTGVAKLDLIGFDACLMGQIDVLQAIAPFGQVAIGSADLEPGEGWAWNAWLSDLARRPPSSAAALAPSIIKSFTAFYKEEADSSVTLAAFDLAKVGQMASQLDTLANAMIAAMPRSYAAIGASRAHAAEYAGGDTDISAIDLGYFADSLVAAGADRPVADAARALSATIKAARIAQGHGADHPKSSGISVYFPWKKKNYDASYTKSSPLTKATSWDAFLQAFYRAGRGQSARATTSKFALSKPATADAPVNLSATIAGPDTAYVYYFVGEVAPADPNTIQILSMDYLYPPGAALNGSVPSWRDGDKVRLAWKSTSWYISNGTTAVPAAFSPIEYGSSAYSVDGTYTYPSGRRVPASLEFAVTQGRATLQHIWAFDKGGSENPRPRELKPRAGATFTPDVVSYSTTRDDMDERTSAGQPISFTSAPLSAFEGPAPSGEYVIGLMVEDIAGTISDQFAKVTIDGPQNDTPALPAAPAEPTAGITAGMLSYRDSELGFRIDYPQDWRPESPSSGSVVFANPEDASGAVLGIDAYELAGTLAAANSAIVRELLDSAAQEPGFALLHEAASIRVAGHLGQRVEYSYRDRDGATIHVVGVAVSDKPAGATYLVTFAAPEPAFAGSAPLLEQLLKSFTVD